MTNLIARTLAFATDARRGFALAFCLISPVAFIGCPGSGSGSNSANSVPASSSEPAVSSKSPFDGQRAFEHVRKQVEFGPRPAGSAELEQTRNYITGELKSYGLSVTTDEFTASTPMGDKKMVNVTAELPGASRDVIIISSHYDTKLYQRFRFVGANDAGSSTGALMEIARVMASTREERKYTYWFVFFDGEEAFCPGWDDCTKPGAPDNTYGSRHYVAQLQTRNELARVRAMILLDMIGYTNQQFGRSDMSTGWLLDIIWRVAKDLGYGSIFVNRAEGVGGDDHEPFLKAGVESVIDIIQLTTYEHWHTKEDTLDKISVKSLKVVGDVILNSLPKIEERLQSRPH
jgi:hypothetical protein